VKRASALLIGVLLAAFVASAIASAHGTSHRRSRARVAAGLNSAQLRKTKLGKILVNTAGTTLYEFTSDHPNTDTCVKIAGCTSVWIPQTLSGRLKAGPGVRRSSLSTLKSGREKGQLTYARHPLYIYSGDTGPGQTAYVGAKQFGGHWYAINAKGRPVK
jgi:predicted lipoprotein with Yx(FWY)xxD motif